MTLQLAENGFTVGRRKRKRTGFLPEESPYIYVPGDNGEQGVWVREDMFDHLPEDQWNALMAECEARQPDLGLFGLTKKSRERIKARKDERNERKLAKIAAKGAARATARGGGENPIMGGLKSIIKTAGQSLAPAIGGVVGGGAEQAPMTPYYDEPIKNEWIPGLPNWATGLLAAGAAFGIYKLATR